jgi:2-polyprenyl-3-methyl-5-hydroxy-6-metoxy-1,4-benzoquinol methylase
MVMKTRRIMMRGDLDTRFLLVWASVEAQPGVGDSNFAVCDVGAAVGMMSLTAALLLSAVE